MQPSYRHTGCSAFGSARLTPLVTCVSPICLLNRIVLASGHSGKARNLARDAGRGAFVNAGTLRPRLCKNAEKFGARKIRPLRTAATRFSRCREWSPYPRKFHVFPFLHSLGQKRSVTFTRRSGSGGVWCAASLGIVLVAVFAVLVPVRVRHVRGEAWPTNQSTGQPTRCAVGFPPCCALRLPVINTLDRRKN